MQGTTERTMPATATTSIAPTKVDLPSVIPALPPTVVRITVDGGGTIPLPPGRFFAGLDEVVSWVITNHSGTEVTVALSNFKKKDHFSAARATQPAEDYFEWISLRKVKLEDGDTKRIYGRVRRLPDNPIDCLSYTIEVRSTDHTSFAWDYDPDGDIKP